MRKIWDIHGGVHPPENKQQSVALPIGTISLADEIILPLNQHIGAPATPVVAVGDTVLKGQLIANAQGIFSACVHASTSGEVIAIEDRAIAHPSGLSAPCVVIQPDGKDRWITLEPCEHYQDLDHGALIEKIRQAGLAGMGGAGFPTAVKLNPRTTDAVDTLILNGTECEPYITADDMLMREHAHGVVQGALLLAKIVGKPQHILVGIEDNKPEAIAAMETAAQNTPVEIVVFPTKYPSGGEKQLIQILTGKEVPSGKIPAQVGVLVQNVGTAYAAWRAVRFGEPLVERITTVVGEALAVQRNIRVAIGTPISHILAQHGFDSGRGSRLIVGGPMMGYTVDNSDAPIVKTSNCVLLPSAAEMPEPPPAQACIRCGMCAEACPASLLPQQLYWYAQADDHDKLQSHNLMDCIECGACSFVCPSAIPLVQYYRAAKADIRREAADKAKSDRARERFEQRQERQAKADAEKEAKRQARKQAAEEAKRRLAESKPDTATPPATASLAETAVANAKVNAPSDPAQQEKKLARALSSAESRVDRVKKQIAECEDTARGEALRAQLKQAELKASEANQKLTEFNQSGPATLTQQAQQVEARLQASPQELQLKAVASLQQRLQVAREKAALAVNEGAPTAAALEQGVSKLQGKLEEAQQALAELQTQTKAAAPVDTQTQVTVDAAAAAIAKAKAKADAQAQLSPQEKQQAQLVALQTRVEKAREKLLAAEEQESEHIAMLQTALTKLEQKLLAAQQESTQPAD